jgi:hypothetical protein
LGIGVVSGVQVRAADPTAGDLKQHLTLGRFGIGQVDDGEVVLVASDRSHDGRRLSSKDGSGSM